MVSFDVISFIKNIPIIDTLNIIKDYVNNDDQFTIKTDGVAMGGRASSTVTEIYMQAHKETAISMALHRPKIWEQIVYDFYSILECVHLENFFIASTISIKTLSLL